MRVFGQLRALVNSDIKGGSRRITGDHLAKQSEQSNGFLRLKRALFLCTILFAIIVLEPRRSFAEDNTNSARIVDAFGLGDIAASGFSGLKLQTEGVAPGVDPVSKTVIDPDGVSLRIIDGSAISVPLNGQQLHLPTRQEFKAGQIGHVFGLAFDAFAADDRGTPGLYAAATSAFGLHIVGPDLDNDGQPDRLTTGAPGTTFMEGLFGTTLGGGPGAIWKVDQATGALGLYAELASDGVPNSGPGIGGLAFDPNSRSIYASDLDTGLIHQLRGAAQGIDLSQFDHGITGRPSAERPAIPDDGARLDITAVDFDPASPSTWKTTQAERRVDGMAVHKKRLYYAVADGPEIWSVGLNEDGSFQQDARIETAVSASQPGFVTAITFDAAGNMILALRNAVQNTGDYLALVTGGPADVIRFIPVPQDDPQTALLWNLDALTYPVGQSEEKRDGSGGVALQYAYRPDGGIDTSTCSGTLIATGDALDAQQTVHGLQIGGINQFRAVDQPAGPVAFVSTDPAQDLAGARGHAGSVAVLTRCNDETSFPQVAAGEPALPGVAGEGGTGFPAVAGNDATGQGLPDVEGGSGGKGQGFPDVEGGGGGGKTKQGPFTIEKTGKSPSCDETKPCTWEIKVTNDTDKPVPGPITIQDLLSISGKPLTQAKLVGAPTAPWVCVSSAAPGMNCTHPGPFPPKTSVPLTLTFQPLPGSIGAAKEIQNCAVLSITAPQQQGAALPAPTSTDSGGMKAILEPLMETCSPKSGICTWSLGIKETGGNDNFFGNAKVAFTFVGNDNKPIKSELSSFTKNIFETCQPQGSQTICTGTVGLSKGGFGSQLLDFKVDPSKGAPGSFVTATADVTVEIKGQTLSSKASASTLLATSDVEPLRLGGNFGTDIKVEMISNTACTPGAACDWEMKLTNATVATITGELQAIFSANLGLTPFNNPKTVEKFEVVTNPPDTICTPEPNQALQIRCINKAISLAPGANMSLKPTLRIVPVALTQAVFFDISGSAFFGKFDAQGFHGTVGSSQIFVRIPDKEGLPVEVGDNGGAPPAAPGQQQDGAQGKPAVPACARIPVNKPALPPKASAVGQLSLNKSAIAGSCKNSRSCDFTISVTNTGNAPANGPIEFSDEVTADGGFFGSTVLTAAQPWTCSKAGQGFACAATLTLAAKEKKDFTFTADLGAGIGAVKEMKNCATLKGAAKPSCATASLDQKPQPDPAATSKLILAKNPAVEQCSDAGGGCEFRVSITNPGPEEFNGPIEFSDTPTKPDGTQFLNLTLESVTPLIPEGAVSPISCNRVGDGFTCGTGPVVKAKLPAGKTIQVMMSFKPGPGTGATAIKNCATMKGVEGKPCATISLVNGPLLRAQKIGGGNTCVPFCAFAINLKNVGNADAIGPFVLAEKFTPAEANVVLEEIDGDFNCGKAGNGSFVCISGKDVLKPGELINGRVKVSGATPSAEYTNCIDYNPAANAKPSPFDTAFPGRCVTVKDTAPKRPNLVIKKQAPNAEGVGDGHCDLKNSCRFSITVSNNGSGDYVGPIEITDIVSLGVPQFMSIGPGSSPSFKWECTSSQNGAGGIAALTSISCKLPSLTMAPGTSVPLEVAVTAGTTWKGSNRLGNCAELVATGDIGPLDIGKKSCVFVKLDPFAVKVVKTGDQTCAPGGDCHFRISLFNPGPIDHDAPVTISDKLTGLSSAQIISINPPLPCAVQPTQIPFTCTSADNVRLDLDALPGTRFGPRNFDMLVRLPNDATAAQFSNCASVAGDADAAAGDTACHSVTLQPVADLPGARTITKTAASANCDEANPCSFNVTVTNTTTVIMPGPIVIDELATVGDQPLTQFYLAPIAAPWTCIASAAPGMQCSHPGPLLPKTSVTLTLTMQPMPGSLGEATEIKNCATLEGVRAARATACASIPVIKPVSPAKSKACSSGLVLTNGICICPPPARWNGLACAVGAGGSNTPKQPEPAPLITEPKVPASCNAGMTLTPSGLCVCPDGTRWNGTVCDGTGGSNKVQPPVPAKPAPLKCSKGQLIDLKTLKCVACRSGTHVEGNACVADKPVKPKPQVCTGKRPVGDYPNCCPRGTEFKRGKCRAAQNPDEPRPEARACPDNRPVGAYPNCCPQGYEFKRGKCRAVQIPDEPQPEARACPDDRPVGTYPNCCPDGTEFSKGKCRPPKVQEQQFCEGDRPNGIYPNCCPFGYDYSRGKCRRIEVQQPEPQPEKPVERDCGPGYRVRDTLNKYGNYCDLIPVPGPEPTPPPPPPQPQCNGNQEMIDGQCIDRIN